MKRARRPRQDPKRVAGDKQGSLPVRAAAPPLSILLVEDNPADARLVSELLGPTETAGRLSAVSDGEAAMEFLRRTGRYSEAARPDVVLLDLNLPVKNGLEVLAEIKGDPELKRIPVVILTGSSRQEDIARAYELHANCYIIKPANIDDFARVAKSLNDFWSKIAQLPEDSPNGR